MKKANVHYNRFILEMFKHGNFRDMCQFYSEFAFTPDDDIARLVDGVSEYLNLSEYCEFVGYKSKEKLYREIDSECSSSYYLSRSGDYIYLHSPFGVAFPIATIDIKLWLGLYECELIPVQNWEEMTFEHIS